MVQVSSRSSKVHYRKPVDWVLLCAVALLSIAGAIFLASASAALGFHRFGSSWYYITHQLIYGFLPGITLCIIFTLVDYHRLKPFAIPALLLSFALLLLVFVPHLGATYNGARSWIAIYGVSLQPSEIVKLTLLIYVAAWLEGKTGRTNSWSETFFPFIVVFGVIATLIMLQPDLGTLLILAAIAFAVYFAAGMRWSQLGLLLGLAIAGLAGAIALAPYRLQRLLTFLNPSADPQGSTYQISQALIGIGSGGLWGAGLGQSRQKLLFLPEIIGDSVFAVVAEELGFIFTALIIILYGIFIWRGFWVAEHAPDAFGKYLAVGITVWVGAQAFINMMAMLGLLPLTGLPLPFVSYGGSSLVVLFAAMGILMNITRQARD